MWDDGPPGGALVEHVANNYQENGYRFVPLANKDWNLSCAISVLLLRRDYPGSLVTHGDLDNRLKSLIDGLRKPEGANELREHASPDNGEDPFYVLLQDDKLITDLRVETDVLLTPESACARNDVLAIISVEIKPYDISTFNLSFAS